MGLCLLWTSPTTSQQADSCGCEATCHYPGPDHITSGICNFFMPYFSTWKSEQPLSTLVDYEMYKEKEEQTHISDSFPNRVRLPGQWDWGGAGSDTLRELRLEEASRKATSIDTESTRVVSRAWGKGESCLLFTSHFIRWTSSRNSWHNSADILNTTEPYRMVRMVNSMLYVITIF